MFIKKEVENEEGRLEINTRLDLCHSRSSVWFIITVVRGVAVLKQRSESEINDRTKFEPWSLSERYPYSLNTVAIIFGDVGEDIELTRRVLHTMLTFGTLDHEAENMWFKYKDFLIQQAKVLECF